MTKTKKQSFKGRFTQAWREIEDGFGDIGTEARKTLGRARHRMLSKLDEAWDSPTEERQRALLAEQAKTIKELESSNTMLSEQLAGRSTELRETVKELSRVRKERGRMADRVLFVTWMLPVVLLVGLGLGYLIGG